MSGKAHQLVGQLCHQTGCKLPVQACVANVKPTEALGKSQHQLSQLSTCLQASALPRS